MKSTRVDAYGTIQLDVDQWLELFRDKDIFKKELMDMLLLILDQENQESTATILAEHYGVKQQRVTRWYVDASRKIYERFGIDPPPNDKGGKKYWDTCFLNKPDHQENQYGHWYLQLRPALAEALHTITPA